MEHDPGLETQNQAYYTSMEECSNEFLKAAERTRTRSWRLVTGRT